MESNKYANDDIQDEGEMQKCSNTRDISITISSSHKQFSSFSSQFSAEHTVRLSSFAIGMCQKVIRRHKQKEVNNHKDDILGKQKITIMLFFFIKYFVLK